MRATTSLAILSAAALCGCAQVATVKEKEPRLTVAGPSPLARSAEQKLALAQKTGLSNPQQALGEELAVAAEAYRALLRNPGDDSARQVYNYAVGRVAEAVEDAKLAPWKRSVNVNTPAGPMVLTGVLGPGPEYDPSNYDLLFADRMVIGGDYYKKRIVDAEESALRWSRSATRTSWSIPRNPPNARSSGR